MILRHTRKRQCHTANPDEMIEFEADAVPTAELQLAENVDNSRRGQVADLQRYLQKLVRPCGPILYILLPLDYNTVLLDYDVYRPD